MKRNCLFNYLKKHKVEKDIVVYEYKNPYEYLLVHTGNTCFKTYSLYCETYEPIKDKNTLDLVWTESNILCEYEQSGVLYLQVNFGK